MRLIENPKKQPTARLMCLDSACDMLAAIVSLGCRNDAIKIIK
jgi:hypothetical protein